MTSYRFTYRDASGGLIRSAVMPCASDEDAVRRARETMRDGFAELEILAGERLVFRQIPVKA